MQKTMSLLTAVTLSVMLTFGLYTPVLADNDYKTVPGAMCTTRFADDAPAVTRSWGGAYNFTEDPITIICPMTRHITPNRPNTLSEVWVNVISGAEYPDPTLNCSLMSLTYDGFEPQENGTVQAGYSIESRDYPEQLHFDPTQIGWAPWHGSYYLKCEVPGQTGPSVPFGVSGVISYGWKDKTN